MVIKIKKKITDTAVPVHAKRAHGGLEVHHLLYPGARGGSLATSYTPHLTMCMHSCTFGLLTILETEGFCNPSIYCVLSVRRRWQGCGKICSGLSITEQEA